MRNRPFSWPWWRRRRYESVASEEKGHALLVLGAEEGSSPLERDGSGHRMGGWCHVSPQFILLTIANFVVLFTTIALKSLDLPPWSVAVENACIKSTSYFSPVIEQVRLKHHNVLLNGTFFPGAQPAFSRQAPGDTEAEALWGFFEAIRPFPITRDDVLALGKDPDTVSKFPNELFGLGDDAYVAALDIQHKLHCLNVLRQLAFRGYGETAAREEAQSQMWWLHIRHCVDIVTQDLMCHADADLITYQWVDAQLVPQPDLSVNRRCRDIHDLFKYRDERMVDIDKYGEMRKPKSGIVQVPSEPEYYALFGFEDSDLYPGGEGYGPLPSHDWFGLSPTQA